ncbi:MAG TPA: A24 family peptidase [Acidimicrobiales bacterium]|jgi:leader peptidase (prepilin peptidase)/N-methyltransferase|nr:A24 family peptidase [Acidimicrobiales bacterium]
MDALLIVGAAAVCGPVAAGLDIVVAGRAARIPISADEIDVHQGGPGFTTLTATRHRVRTIPHRTVVAVGIAVLCAAALAAHTGSTWALPAGLALIAGAVPLGVGDVEWLLLPKAPVWWTAGATAAAIAAGAGATGEWHVAFTSLVAATALTGLLAVISVVNRAWMGFGDVRLAVPIGLALAWAHGGRGVFLGFLLANVLAGLTAAVLLLSGRMSRSSALPFGPFLGAGAVSVLIAIH